MARSPKPLSDHELIQELVTQFRQRLRAGEKLDRSKFIAEHPALAQRLAAALDEVSVLDLAPQAESPLEPPAPLPFEAPPAQVGPYRLLELLGQGAMGRVYRAHREGMAGTVAIKILHGGLGLNQNAARRLLREAMATRDLQHPNIVSVLDSGEADGIPYLVMELVEGGRCLRHLLQPRGSLPPARAMALVRDIALGLARAHARGIIHRDLKPANVLMDGETPRVTDFGLAHVAGEDLSRITKSGELVGTICYMPPEQAKGERHPTPCWDLYSLGATLYELLTGQPPFIGDVAGETLLKLVNDDPLPLYGRIPGVTREMEAIVMKCLEKTPRQRYQNAEELAAEITRCLSGGPVAAPLINWPIRRLRRTYAKHRNAIALGLCASIFLGVSLWQLDAMRYRGLSADLENFQGAPPPGAAEYRLPFLLRASRDPRAEIRIQAHRAMLRQRNDQVDEVLLRAARDPDPNVRMFLAKDMLAHPGALAVNICDQLLDEPGGEVVANAVRLAQELHDPRFVHKLVRLAYSSDKTVRQYVMTALIPAMGEGFPGFAETYLREGPAAGRLQLLERCQQGRAPVMPGALLAILADPQSGAEIKDQAKSALRFFTGQDLGDDLAAWQNWWDISRKDFAISKIIVIFWADSASTLRSGDLVWRMDGKRLTLDSIWPPANSQELTVLRGEQMVLVHPGPGNFRANTLFMGALAGRFLGEHPVVELLNRAVHASTTTTTPRE